MGEILAITGPIFLAIGLGYVSTNLGLFSRAELWVLGRFVLNLALPALLCESLAERQVGEVLNLSYLVAYGLGSLAVLGLGYLWGRRVNGQPHTVATFYAMGMACSNSGFIGYPILLLVMAPYAAVALALNMLVENLVVLPILLVMAEMGRGRGGEPWWRILLQPLVRLARNPMILALLIGVAISLSGWRLPLAVERTVSMFALASGAVSLFVIGGSLTGQQGRGMVCQVVPIVVGKLICHPLLVLLAFLLMPVLGLPAIDLHLRTGAVVLAAVPMLSIYTILAQAYGADEGTAQAMLVTTVASFFTLSGLLFLLRNLSG